MSPSRKKVIVRKFSRDWLAGYLPPAGFAERDRIELLDLAGKVATLRLNEVKWLSFVREFNSGEAENPERLLRKTFVARPRSEGLWMRLKLTDGDSIEGLATNDLSLIEGSGIFITPPDIRSNTQRLFIPHSSISELEVVAIIANPSKKKAAETPRQEELFGRPD